ncbi:MAG TPA: hypothetical protein VN493_01445 [Thermoanaerobaculia bacterium]|nr:hypothetical protein [Thermoanaerobaculia bacterium]
MKNFALVIAFALLAAVPASAASAAEISKPVPAMTPVKQTLEVIPLFQKGPIQPYPPRCYTLHGNSCPAAGATQACTDVCNNNLSCTCHNFYGGPYGTTFLGRYWVCDYEC